jgi:hypothetical protein
VTKPTKIVETEKHLHNSIGDNLSFSKEYLNLLDRPKMIWQIWKDLFAVKLIFSEFSVFLRNILEVKSL